MWNRISWRFRGDVSPVSCIWVSDMKSYSTSLHSKGWSETNLLVMVSWIMSGRQIRIEMAWCHLESILTFEKSPINTETLPDTRETFSWCFLLDVVQVCAQMITCKGLLWHDVFIKTPWHTGIKFWQWNVSRYLQDRSVGNSWNLKQLLVGPLNLWWHTKMCQNVLPLQQCFTAITMLSILLIMGAR